MQRTKLGISAGLLGAAICFSGLFGGYLLTGILVGYVLLFEENIWLRKSAVKTFALMIGFSLMSAVIGLLPSAINMVNDIFMMFGGFFSIGFITNFIAAILTLLDMIKTILLVVMGARAVTQGTVAIPVIDNLINKHMGN